MRNSSQFIQSNIRTSVGNGLHSDPKDVISIRKNLSMLKRLRNYNEDPLIDRELDTAIRKFQRDKDLREDGLIEPGGETEKSLNQALHLAQTYSDEESDDDIEREDLAPPDEPKIPGTDIPDRGIPEGGYDSPSYDPNAPEHDEDMDPGILLPIPDEDMDPGILLPIPDPESDEERIAAVELFMTRKRGRF